MYSRKYCEVYSSDPASAPGRIEPIRDELRGLFDFVEPEPASEEDLRLVHSQNHIDRIKRQPRVYEIGVLAVGGAVEASEIAMGGEPAFGLVRPPGHHASRDHCWGFCYFNNLAISVEKLRRAKRVRKVLIVDFDLHFGDGTANIFAGVPQVSYHHVGGRGRREFLEDLKIFLSAHKQCDIVGVSAGFDRHEEDWGGMLKTGDYGEMGKMIKEYSLGACDGKRYAVLEGGYNHEVLGKNVRAFLEGFGKPSLGLCT